MTHQELIDWLRLSLSENVGPTTFRQLLLYFGSAGEALAHLAELAAKGGKKKIKIAKTADVFLYCNKIVVGSGDGKKEFTFDTVHAVTVLGRNKLNIYHDGHIYQLKSDCRFNALKYVHIFHRCKNILKGDANEQFLGL